MKTTQKKVQGQETIPMLDTEEKLIELFSSQSKKQRRVKPVVGIGDDGAVVSLGPSDQLVVTSDALVEDVHFVRSRISAEDLGWKSLAVNLSDLAAMGATPKWVLLNLSLPKRLEKSWIPGFAKGFFKLCKEFQVQLIGGDTTGSFEQVYISVTALGTLKKNKFRLRSQAKAGDILCVTGPLGLSRAGLELQSQYSKPPYVKRLIESHHRPIPRVKEGFWLTQQKGVGAMMDISDGLFTDAKRMAHQSKVGLQLDLGSLPITKDLSEYCKHFQKSEIEEVLLGGEDYELLFTLSQLNLVKLKASYRKEFGHDFHPIGRVVKSPKSVVGVHEGQELSLDFLSPFNHF